MNWVVYATLSAVFAGLVAIFGKIGVQGVDSTLATTVRAAVMCAAMLTVVLARGTVGQLGDLDRRALLFILLSGLAGAASWICYFRALQLGDALRVAPIDRLSGAVTLVAAALLLHERAPLAAWVGTLMMLIGAVIVARS
jgi:transporter family protein